MATAFGDLDHHLLGFAVCTREDHSGPPTGEGACRGPADSLSVARDQGLRDTLLPSSLHPEWIPFVAPWATFLAGVWLKVEDQWNS